MRKNQKHIWLVRRKWIRVYYSGSYAWLEVDFGKIGRHEIAIFIGCDDRFVRFRYYND